LGTLFGTKERERERERERDIDGGVQNGWSFCFVANFDDVL